MIAIEADGDVWVNYHSPWRVDAGFQLTDTSESRLRAVKARFPAAGRIVGVGEAR